MSVIVSQSLAAATLEHKSTRVFALLSGELPLLSATPLPMLKDRPLLTVIFEVRAAPNAAAF